MIKKLYKWIRQHYLTIINSIAFYPVIIALCFLLFAFLLLQLDHLYKKEYNTDAIQKLLNDVNNNKA